jgi:uncharacterized protein
VREMNETAKSPKQPQLHRGPEAPQYGANQFTIISARWLITWFAVALLVAAACAYLVLCFLFYQGQWQVVFHPSSSVASTPTNAGIPFDDVRFDFTETGLPQLDGWWIPALPNPVPTSHPIQTILYLHGADGSLADTVPTLRELHSLGVNLFAIDYRGFGLSMPTHPSEQRVDQDADAALTYLTDVRHIDQHKVIVYGEGLGATIAAELARRYPSLAGLVLDDPAPSGLSLINRDPRTRLLPVRLLFRDRFELAPKLSYLRVPKLFIEGPDTHYFAAAPGPKTLIIPSEGANHAALPQLGTFLRSVPSPH